MLAESKDLSDNNLFKTKVNNSFLDNPFYIFKSFKVTVCLFVNACALKKDNGNKVFYFYYRFYTILP